MGNSLIDPDDAVPYTHRQSEQHRIAPVANEYTPSGFVLGWNKNYDMSNPWLFEYDVRDYIFFALPLQLHWFILEYLTWI